ncbi:MAG: hypothetical protein OEN01_16145, partial [Candidatus Krumholzibacteria bacterium]|nr:hypothetical protein [Candidatus Krumholzibacteria bacterium]
MLKQLLAAVVLVAMMSPTLLFGQKTTQTKKEKESRPNIITPKDDKDAVKARDHKHIAEFERLVAELHSLDMPRDRSKYKKLNGKLRAAMQRASAQARARSIRAGRTQATRTGTRSQEVMPGERPTDVVSK